MIGLVFLSLGNTCLDHDPDPGTLPDNMIAIPGGTFEMGDHSGLGGEDPKHPSDELPLHSVTIATFAMNRTETTATEYAEFLNAVYAAGSIEVAAGVVRLTTTQALLFETRSAAAWSPIDFSGDTFSVITGKETHPVVGVRWFGAIAYANWLSEKNDLSAGYDLASGAVDFSKKCYRLPTEAEWEYAAIAGQYDPYPIYPWGDDLDPLKANWPNSGDPWESAADPKTTPVGFFDGSLRLKADFNWPGTMANFQTHDGRNGYDLADMAGNAWEWVNDWYRNDYYSVSPSSNPPGPNESEASAMPDGQKYRVMRGGNWYNGTTPQRPDGHSRASNRDPSYFRGPGDPNGPWFHVGLRVILAHPE
jgi:formylglycine-generating enzyme required for sulfatase activity